MKYFLFLIICVGLMGCTSVEIDEYGYTFTPRREVVQSDRVAITNIEHIYVGMSLKEVQSIMGDNLEIGYETDSKINVFVPVSMKTPYKKNSFKIQGHRYEVVYYFVHVVNPDGKVSNEELMPLVFEGDKLIGKGYKFLSKLKE